MKYIEANRGYKTLTSNETGNSVNVGYDLIQNPGMSPSSKLIYAYLKSHEIKSSKTATVSMDTLSSKSGYAKHTVQAALSDLEAAGAIVTIRRESKRTKGRFYNEYKLNIDGDMFAMITMYFLESSLLTRKEKEFILLIFPLILGNDTIGSIKNPASFSFLSEQTGLTQKTISRRIHSLKDKGLVWDHYTKPGTHGRSFLVGYKFDMRTIMLNNNANIIQERNIQMKKLIENDIY